MPLTFRLFAKSTTLYIQPPALLVIRRAIKEDLTYMLRRISTGGEVIEDSEPERQERRRKDQEERSKKKNLKSMGQQTIANNEQKMINVPQVSVIELSGSFGPCHNVSSPLTRFLRQMTRAMAVSTLPGRRWECAIIFKLRINLSPTATQKPRVSLTSAVRVPRQAKESMKTTVLRSR
jgi:hypothetical protein